MIENTEKYLPIGSVVLLKGGTKKAMITGFCSVAGEDKKKMYDYTGCIYPEGFLDFEQICLFDHDQIEKVYHIGYVDEEEEDFKKELVQIANNFETGKEDTESFFDEYMGNSEEDDDNDDSEDDDSETKIIDTQNIELEDVNRRIGNYEYL